MSQYVLIALSELGPGDWPSWFSAVGTVFAFAAAAIALFLQYRTAKRDHLQSRREQASKVWATIERTSVGQATFRFKVLNYSGLPCYFMHFEVYEPGAVRYFRLGTLSSKEYEHDIELSSEYAELWPYFRISFMDSGNVFWVRDSSGHLQETSDGSRRVASRPAETFAERRSREVRSRTVKIRRDVQSLIESIDPNLGSAPLP